jgi:hypothetical protein
MPAAHQVLPLRARRADTGHLLRRGRISQRGGQRPFAQRRQTRREGCKAVLRRPALRAFVERFPVFRRETFAFRSDNQLAHLALLRAGFGIGAAQVPIAEREPLLVRVLPEEFAAELETWIVMHEDLRSTPRCRAVFDALLEAFG